MIKIDEKKVFSTIEERKPKAVAFQAPDGILAKTVDVASKVEDKYGINTFIMADPTFGICDTADDYADALGADIMFHVGHTVSVERMGKNTILVDAFDNISFYNVLKKALSSLNGYKNVGLCTSSQHVRQLEPVKRRLIEKGYMVHIGEGKGLLRDGHVFGCEFYPVFNIRDMVDAFIFLGSSRFHGLGVALSTGKPTLMLDPYVNEVVDLGALASERLKRAILGIYNAKDAEIFGVIVGLKDGQIMKQRSLKIKKDLEDRGKKVKLLALREVTEDRLAIFPHIEAFVQTACPRISIDGYTFSRTVLSSPQTDALIKLLDGEDIGDFLIKNHWL